MRGASQRLWGVWQEAALLLCVSGVLSCKGEPAHPHVEEAKPVSCPPPAPACPSPRPAAPEAAAPEKSSQPPPGSEETERLSLARFYPGADSARSPRTHRPNSVILFAPPGERLADGALASVDKLRFQPIVCVLGGKLATGARCGEAMPARAKVRVTDSGSSQFEELEVERSNFGFRDENGGTLYPAPYGPACCMYNTCVGRTVPYYARPQSAQSAFFTTKTLLAIWPADAELELETFQPGRPEELSLEKAPWKTSPCQQPSCLVQAAESHGRSYVSIREPMHGVGLFAFADPAKGWQRLMGDMGVREYFVLSATDLDRDGRPEILVYARWANDYALHLFANDELKPLYGFSCGNI